MKCDIAFELTDDHFSLYASHRSLQCGMTMLALPDPMQNVNLRRFRSVRDGARLSREAMPCIRRTQALVTTVISNLYFFHSPAMHPRFQTFVS